jgi:hypothetical protein
LHPVIAVAAAVSQSSGEVPSNWQCPRCRGPMIVLLRLTSADLSRCSYFDSS